MFEESFRSVLRFIPHSTFTLHVELLQINPARHPSFCTELLSSGITATADDLVLEMLTR